MFREMRRKNQLLSREETIGILERGTSGVLAVCGDDRCPYAVPLSYVLHENSLYFHCAKSGHKLDAIAENDKASFCVIDQDQIVAAEYTTYFRSAVCFGTMRILTEEAEKRNAFEILAAKYSPEQAEGRRKEIDRLFDVACIMELCVEHMSGKEAIELRREKKEES